MDDAVLRGKPVSGHTQQVRDFIKVPRMLKILYVVHQFLPDNRYGTELSTYEMAKAQQNANHDITIFCGAAGYLHKEVFLVRDIYDTLPVVRVYFNPRNRRGFLYNDRLNRVFSRFLDVYKPDLIHIQHLANLSLSLISVARSKHIPVVMHLRDYSFVCLRTFFMRGNGATCFTSNLTTDCLSCISDGTIISRSLRMRSLLYLVSSRWTAVRFLKDLRLQLLKKITRTVSPMQIENLEDIVNRNQIITRRLEEVSCIVTACTDIKERYQKFIQIPEKKFIVLAKTVDTSRLQLQRRTIVPGSPIRFGYVGKLVRLKGLHILLNAFTQLPPTKAILHIYGTPHRKIADIAYYLNARELGNRRNIYFSPRGFARNEIRDIYSSFDILVMPTVGYEPFGRTVIEAFASGIPVICSDIGGPAELVADGVNGYHFRVGDSSSLLEILTDVIAHPEKVEQLSNNIVPPKKMCDYAKEHEELYFKLVNQSKG